MSKVIFTRGIQGSGKSFWAKDFCTKNSSAWVRVSRDDLRNMRGVYWKPKQEDLITDWERELVISALTRGMNVIIDAMNLNEKSVNSMKSHIKAKGFTDIEYSVEDFTKIPLEVCIKRDKERPNSIGEKILRQTWNKYLAPKIEPHVHVKGLPHAIICDLDGTLALFGDKNPYERDFINDKLNEAVNKVIDGYINSRNPGSLIIFSGRSDRFKEETSEWLKKYGIKPDIFEMRTTQEEKAQVKDVIVKERMFETFVRGNFNIDFVLDDRLQVCRLWHSLGLSLLRVGNPDADF